MWYLERGWDQVVRRKSGENNATLDFHGRGVTSGDSKGTLGMSMRGGIAARSAERVSRTVYRSYRFPFETPSLYLRACTWLAMRRPQTARISSSPHSCIKPAYPTPELKLLSLLLIRAFLLASSSIHPSNMEIYNLRPAKQALHPRNERRNKSSQSIQYLCYSHVHTRPSIKTHYMLSY